MPGVTTAVIHLRIAGEEVGHLATPRRHRGLHPYTPHAIPHHDGIYAVSNVIQHPRAVEIVRKTQRAAEAAQEKAERAEHRKWLKETKPRRDAQKARGRRYYAAEQRIINAALAGAAGDDDAYFAIMDAAGLAAEATAAKAAGYDTWAAFQAAQEATDD